MLYSFPYAAGEETALYPFPYATGDDAAWYPYPAAGVDETSESEQGVYLLTRTAAASCAAAEAETIKVEKDGIMYVLIETMKAELTTVCVCKNLCLSNKRVYGLATK